MLMTTDEKALTFMQGSANEVTRIDKSRGPKRKQHLKNVRVDEFPLNSSDPIRIITPFGSQWNLVRSVLEKHWGILTNSLELTKIVSTSPMLVARRARSLGDMLIRSSLKNQMPHGCLNIHAQQACFRAINAKCACWFIELPLFSDA